MEWFNSNKQDRQDCLNIIADMANDNEHKMVIRIDEQGTVHRPVMMERGPNATFEYPFHMYVWRERTRDITIDAGVYATAQMKYDQLMDMRDEIYEHAVEYDPQNEEELQFAMRIIGEHPINGRIDQALARVRKLLCCVETTDWTLVRRGARRV